MKASGSLREKFLDAILESASDYGIISMDLDGLVTSWNAGAHRVLGWTEDEMVGRPASVFFTPEDRRHGIPAAEMQAALQRGRGSDERWHLRADGSRFWASGEMMPLLDETGTAMGLLKILRDRTAERLAAERQRADAEFLRSVLASSGDCIKVLDLQGRLLFMSEGGKKLMEVSDFNAISGCAWPDFWAGEGNAAAHAALAEARAGGIGRFQGSAPTFAGNPRWWDVQVTPILGADGLPEKLLSVSRDITSARQAEEDLRNALGLNNLILDSSHDCIVVLDLEGHTQFVSPGGIAAMEIADLDAVIGLSWLRVWEGADHDAAVEAVSVARAGGVGRFTGFCPTHTGRPKWWDVAISPLAGPDGRPDRLVSIGRDVTEKWHAEDQRRLLMEELAHRVKNTLAVVHAIARQTLRGDGEIAEGREAFAARLMALAQAHDVLMQGSWTKADLHALVEGVARLHCQGELGNFLIEGPEVTLGPKAALSFALVLHEMGTNAVKYGALSVPQGRVAVSWRLDRVNHRAALHLRWQESGGPVVRQPTRKGFGSRLIERSLAGGIGARVDLAYPSSGVTLILEADLAALQTK